jgi:rubrerythrin
MQEEIIHEQETNAEEPNMTSCERCGFPCDSDRDELCPWCKQTKRSDGYRKLRIPYKPDGDRINL